MSQPQVHKCNFLGSVDKFTVTFGLALFLNTFLVLYTRTVRLRQHSRPHSMTTMALLRD